MPAGRFWHGEHKMDTKKNVYAGGKNLYAGKKIPKSTLKFISTPTPQTHTSLLHRRIPSSFYNHHRQESSMGAKNHGVKKILGHSQYLESGNSPNLH